MTTKKERKEKVQREKCQIYSVTHLFFLALDYRDPGGLLYVYNSQRKIICNFTEKFMRKCYICSRFLYVMVV